MQKRIVNNGVQIPALGFGTWRSYDEECYQAVLSALATGYRHIDTAALYENEEAVGRAVRDSGIPRSELFITSKVWNTVTTYDEVEGALQQSLEKLQMDYLDLYLIHWPNPIAVRDCWQQRNAEVWRAMEDAYEAKKIRAIGVSNFMVHHLEALAQTARICPAVNQIKICPGVYQQEVIDYCRSKKIVLEAWRPLGNGELMTNETMQQLAQKYNCTVAQLALAWSLQEGFVPLPKSVHPERIAENFACTAITIEQDDSKSIQTIQGISAAYNPDQRDF